MSGKDISAPILDWTVCVNARVRGAIGTFQDMEFTVRAVTADDARDLWFARYGERFEATAIVALAAEGSDRS